MRVLLVSWEYPPVIEGGLGRHVFKLSVALAGAGHDVHVLTRGSAADEPLPAAASGEDRVQVHRVDIPPFSYELSAFMNWVDELNARLEERGLELLDGESFDLVHSHDWMVAGAARRIAGAAGAPWLVTVHATEFGRHNGWVHTHPQREIHLTERRMVRDAGHVICCSEYMAGHVRRVFGVAPDQVSAIPNGIDAADLAPRPGTDLAAIRALYARPDQQLVLMVGRLVYEKGFHVALEALNGVARADPGVRFVVAGAGTAESDLHAQAKRLGLSRRGVFLGRVDDHLLHALYRVADVAVVPSLYEPFGIVPLEAMVSGCPVIVADTGGLREVAGDERVAVRFAPGDVAGLAGALTRVLGDASLRASMRRAGRLHADSFDWRAVAGQTEGVYAELISSARPLGV